MPILPSCLTRWLDLLDTFQILRTIIANEIEANSGGVNDMVESSKLEVKVTYRVKKRAVDARDKISIFDSERREIVVQRRDIPELVRMLAEVLNPWVIGVGSPNQ